MFVIGQRDIDDIDTRIGQDFFVGVRYGGSKAVGEFPRFYWITRTNPNEFSAWDYGL